MVATSRVTIARERLSQLPPMPLALVRLTSESTRPPPLRAAAADWRSCQVLYLADSDASRTESSLRTLGQAPVLTIGDQRDFVQAGGMIGLRVEDNRVRFDVNLGAAQRAGLTLNGQMLKLAGQVLR